MIGMLDAYDGQYYVKHTMFITMDIYVRYGFGI